jgi:hypothetical protein
MEEETRPGYTDRTSKIAETEEKDKERLRKLKGEGATYGCNGGNLVDAIAQEISTGSFS